MATKVSICPASAFELIEKTQDMNPIEKERAAANYFSRGNMFEIGNLVPLTGSGIDIACFYFEASAKLGNPEAKNKLGVYYSKGKGGFPMNEGKALEVYKEAASGKNGSSRAKRNIAIYHAKGMGGLYQDSEMAYMLMSEVQIYSTRISYSEPEKQSYSELKT
jgi:TPR repeat protein